MGITDIVISPDALYVSLELVLFLVFILSGLIMHLKCFSPTLEAR